MIIPGALYWYKYRYKWMREDFDIDTYIKRRRMTTALELSDIDDISCRNCWGFLKKQSSTLSKRDLILTLHRNDSYN
jgi:hypothetical protein